MDSGQSRIEDVGRPFLPFLSLVPPYCDPRVWIFREHDVKFTEMMRFSNFVFYAALHMQHKKFLNCSHFEHLHDIDTADSRGFSFSQSSCLSRCMSDR